jgi:hypothetical protein
MRDIPMFPMFPEGLDVEIARTCVGRDAFKSTMRTVANADQRAKDVE